MKALILAGGQGRRLLPYTSNIPKPLVPVGDYPILEYVLRQLKHHGFREVILAVNHLAELIRAFAGDGSRWGLDISYSCEDTPLGTAGPLTLIDPPQEDFLVMNGDLLTNIDFSRVIAEHRRSKAVATIVTHPKEVNIDLGVLEFENGLLTNYIEKPTYSFQVSTGIYVFSPEILNYIPSATRFDMPDLINRLIADGAPVSNYQSDFFWLDIGRVSDYTDAQEIIDERFNEFFKD